MRAITACIKLSERAVASAALDRDEGGTRRLDTAELKADSEAFDDVRMSTISSLTPLGGLTGGLQITF